MSARARILVISTMRDEGPHLVEWVAHTRAAGADDILVFSNDCTDGTDRLLDRLAEGGAVTHLRNQVPAGKTPQWAALRAAADHPSTRSADWIAVLDCDEFVNFRAPVTSFQELVATVAEADAIVLPWRLFGNSGHVRRPAGATLDRYTRAIRAEALYPALSRFFKTLYRTEGPFLRAGVHRPKQTNGALPAWRDGSGRTLPADFAGAQGRIMLWGADLATDLVQLNHYSLRSAEDFIVKSGRGLPNRTHKPIDLTYWVERNFNEVEDRSILSMASRTEAEATRLRALPGVTEAEADARAKARVRFEILMQDPEIVDVFGRLILAAGSVTPDRATALSILKRRQGAKTDDA